LVLFTLFEVCLGLGLRIRGEKVDLKKEAIDSHSRILFRSKRVNLTMIYDELVKCHNDSTISGFVRLV